MLTRALFESLLESVVSTPSAHNVQPLRLGWAESEPSLIQIAVVKNRLLPFADPHRRDLQMTTGAMIEGISLFLSQYQFRISEITQSPEQTPDWQGLVTLKLVRDPNTVADDLLAQIPDRYSYRGKFRNRSQCGGLNFSSLLESGFVKVIDDETTIKKVAELYDQVNYTFLKKPGYLPELYSWMRFSPRHPQWAQDGLNTESIALSGIEALGASWVMKPSVFRFLDQIGLASSLVAEAPIVNSAKALLVISCPPAISYMDQGRIFYRSWLAMTKSEIFGAPLSLLSDDPAATKSVLQWSGLPDDLALINVFRVGVPPQNYSRYRRARLAPQELEFVISDKGGG